MNTKLWGRKGETEAWKWNAIVKIENLSYYDIHFIALAKKTTAMHWENENLLICVLFESLWEIVLTPPAALNGMKEYKSVLPLEPNNCQASANAALVFISERPLSNRKFRIDY